MGALCVLAGAKEVPGSDIEPYPPDWMDDVMEAVERIAEQRERLTGVHEPPAPATHAVPRF